MQSNQQGRKFSDSASYQPVYRFPQNQNCNGWQPQSGFSASPSQFQEQPDSSNHSAPVKKDKHHKRRKVLTLWNLFAVIGIITTIVQLFRYLIIPALVYLKVITGGAV